MCGFCYRTQRRKKPETTTVSSVSESEADDVDVIVAHVSTIAEAQAETFGAIKKRNHT